MIYAVEAFADVSFYVSGYAPKVSPDLTHTGMLGHAWAKAVGVRGEAGLEYDLK
jgi:hypothetical protein